jgi:hypothetical protein
MPSVMVPTIVCWPWLESNVLFQTFFAPSILFDVYLTDDAANLAMRRPDHDNHSAIQHADCGERLCYTSRKIDAMPQPQTQLCHGTHGHRARAPELREAVEQGHTHMQLHHLPLSRLLKYWFAHRQPRTSTA